MPSIFNEEELKFKFSQSPIDEFSWHKSEKLSHLAKSNDLVFDVKLLDSGKYSYPYHFHRNAEELFLILSGRVMLRIPKGFKELRSGDIVFFEKGPTGAHQLYNHTDNICTYLDIRTKKDIDICEYPDSGKVNILPFSEIFLKQNQVDYFEGEEDIKKRWSDYKDNILDEI
ncbi:cupin domain-containing protein [Maledivibacter halophilus]|uniref:Cupin domain-containing protein n=1 Tax=Maledivibacter halophilus TaxID=36842 RepID=A0A1T5M2M7_9FIRM|nr:cupin domain-containing protein [Maledivibacter halophilus]SKC82109.1 Cupin domain-containing protein [Maledivibacter halophilus]